MSTDADTPRERLLVAMSGGVDSSVTAALLVDQGYDIVGVFMRNGVKHDVKHAGKPNKQGCCSVGDSIDAASVAYEMGVPFYALNFEDDFRKVIDYFVDEYRHGRTPNPCVVCNNDLKFGKLIGYADDVGATAVATGHYARCRFERGRWRLFRGRDGEKDQSYYLFGLTQAQLARCRFPLGAMEKSEVRTLAERYDLRTKDKPDSQEICFVPNNDYRTLLQAYAPDALQPGPIVNHDGELVGEHRGTPMFTIGQRRGLNIGGGTPYYVTDLQPESQTVVVGTKDQLGKRRFTVTRVNHIAFEFDREASCLVASQEDRESVLDGDGKSFRAHVQIRYRHGGAPCQVQLLADGSYYVELDEPEDSITPGQAAVFYDESHNQECFAGGWIESVG